MKKAIIIGSGAGGATVAKELQGKFDVTILERGGLFHPFTANMRLLEKLRHSGLFFDEREIQLLFPTMRIRKTAEKMVLVKGIGTGGTTTICTGNGLRMDHNLRAIGINLDAEFNDIYRELPLSTAHQQRWKPSTQQLFKTCHQMGLNPQVTTKIGNYEDCKSCGRCVLGCPHGIRWDSRHFVNDAIANGANLITNCNAMRIEIENGHARGVVAKKGCSKMIFNADVMVIAAGGFETPAILQNSGIACQSKLFVDPVLCVATEWHNALQNKEVPMPFVVQQQNYMLSPYFDYLSFFFNKNWRIPARNILSLMIKLADANSGSVSGKKVNKLLTKQDQEHLQQAVELCTEIFVQMRVKPQQLFLGTINAGHPGGMLPLTTKEADSFHPDVLPANVYVADATLLPKSLGNPPILTIIAMAKRVSNIIKKLYA